MGNSDQDTLYVKKIYFQLKGDKERKSLPRQLYVKFLYFLWFYFVSQ